MVDILQLCANGWQVLSVIARGLRGPGRRTVWTAGARGGRGVTLIAPARSRSQHRAAAERRLRPREQGQGGFPEENRRSRTGRPRRRAGSALSRDRHMLLDQVVRDRKPMIAVLPYASILTRS